MSTLNATITKRNIGLQIICSNSQNGWFNKVFAVLFLTKK